jgi:ATP-binding cassette subfamily B protein
LQGHIQFCDVSLQYTDESVVLPHLSLDIEPGERLAIVGHTGAGKTSIIRLIARLYEFQAGTLLIDGHDIRSLDLAHYRAQLGIVPQVPYLFSGTVADNIRYGRPATSDALVAAIARQIGDGDWLNNLPQGLATEVGERGARLSFGQRQLVALARVLLQNPAIFLLDEATASIDPFTELHIQAGLETVMQGRTSITIAHRLSTVVAADRIIVLERGQLIEEGTHRQLLQRGGYYARLYDTYFRHQSLTYIEDIGGVIRRSLPFRQ